MLTLTIAAKNSFPMVDRRKEYPRLSSTNLSFGGNFRFCAYMGYLLLLYVKILTFLGLVLGAFHLVGGFPQVFPPLLQ